MATPSKLKSKMQLLEELGPLSSGGLIAGSGTGAGQAFTGQASGTDFVNSDKLIEANKGKGQAMTEAALSGNIDETADFSDLNLLNGYDPNKDLSVSTAPTVNTNREVERTDEAGNVFKDFFTDTSTGATTTKYNGWSEGDLNAKAENIRGLKGKFENFGKAFGDSPDAADNRATLLNEKNKKNISTYGVGQSAFDSFLSENEGQGVIQSKADKVKGLMGQFDGLDSKVGDVRQGIVNATGKVGVVDGKNSSQLMKTDMVKAAPTKPIAITGLEDGGNKIADAAGETASGIDPSINGVMKNVSGKQIMKDIRNGVNNTADSVVATPVGQAGNAAKDVADTLIGDPTKKTVSNVKDAAKQIKKWKL